MTDRPPSGEVLRRLYDSEINFELRTLWQGLDWVLLGPDLEPVAEGHATEFDDAVEDLAVAAEAHFQDSDFALWRGAHGARS
jgi:hypothetical protein